MYDIQPVEEPTVKAACEFRDGEFVAKVEPQGDRYAFTIRDLRRERPTIHGFEEDYADALHAVEQVMQALENRA